MKCRQCGELLREIVADLGSMPSSNANLTEETLHKPEKWFPLRILVCTNCWLVQTEDFANREELFTDQYPYFSSFSSSWLQHSKTYAETMIELLSLNETSKVVEVASNDGYLLQYFKQNDIPCYGIEPTASAAEIAKAKGIFTVQEFLGAKTAKSLRTHYLPEADLLIANNVVAHVPDINDFIKGMSILLKSKGIATLEFQYLPDMIDNNLWDCIYAEHYSYLSLTSISKAIRKAKMEIYKVERLTTHGGSLRVWMQHEIHNMRRIPFKDKSVDALLKEEKAKGIDSMDYYRNWTPRIEKNKNDLLKFLITAAEDGKKVAAYGAAAKGNTLLNFAGIKKDLLGFVVDRNPMKQGKYLPGSRIPVYSEDKLLDEKPDYILILPWNLKNEISKQLEYTRDWGCKLVTALPELKIF